MDISQVAKLCHNVNRTWCEMNGDDSQPPWGEAPAWQVESAINGVKFHLDNPDASPSHSHENWLKEKEAAGWVYGEIKDAEARTHPCFVPFEELPEDQQLKDHLFRAVVHACSSFVTVAETATS